MRVDRADSFYDSAEGLPPDVRSQHQARRLRAAVAAAYANATAVRERFTRAGLHPDRIHALRDLAPLPVLRKDALPAVQALTPPFGGLLGAPVTALRRIYVSPGPIYDPESRSADYWGLAPALHAAGFRAGDVVLVTFSFHLSPAGHMMDGALDRIGCVVVPGGTGNTEIQARAAADLAASGVIGTPSFVITVLEKLRGLGLRHRLEVALVSGEACPASLRARVHDEHGVRMTQAYATADVGSIAYECPAGQGLHLTDRVAVELLDPETGRAAPPDTAAEVVVTLLEPPYGIVRLGTGDLAAWAPGACPCGRTAPRLAGVLGRVGEAVKIRGMFVHPSEADQVVLGVSEVARYQIVVTRPGDHDEATIRLELHPGADPTGVASRVAGAAQERLRVRLAVEVVPPGTIIDGTPRVLDLRQRK